MIRVRSVLCLLSATVAVGALQLVAGTAAKALVPPVNGLIAFDSARTGNFEIFSMDSTGNAVTQLTNDPAKDFAPAWSPGGTKIAFSSDRGGGNDIWVMNADGTGPTQLTTVGGCEYPSWSPDGSRIAFQRRQPGNWDVWVMNRDGSGLAQLTHKSGFDGSPVWSPDGSRIAFVSDRGGSDDIWAMNADATGLVQLTHKSAIDEHPAWSPDGSKIAFDSDRSGTKDVYTMNTDGTGVTGLTHIAADDYAPAWSPDGIKIAFTSDRSGAGDIYTMNADATALTRLTHKAAVDEFANWQATPVNLVGNPGFETDTTGWNTSGSGSANVSLTQVSGGHSGSYAAQLSNDDVVPATCALNDSPNWVTTTTSGMYTGTLWVRSDTAGASLKLRFREFNGPLVGSQTTTVTLSTSWQKVTVSYNPASPGASTLDFNAYVVNAAVGTCFYADDASITTD